MSRAVPCLVLAVLALTSPAPARGAATRATSEPLPTASRVTAVVIYRQHALVTREAEVVLAGTAARILFSPLPAGIDPTSVRVSGRGAPGVTIRGVEVRALHEAPAASPETEALEEEVRLLSHQQALALERRKTLGVLREFLDGLKATVDQTTSHDLVTRGFPTGDWESAFDFLSSRFDRLAAEGQEIDRECSERSKRLGAVGARLAETASTRSPDRYSAEVLVGSTQGGTTRLSLTYLVSGATWAPLYDARLHPAEAQISIDWLAQIRQTTGEDWDDVAITLTTAQPLGGIDLPRLASVRLVDPSRLAQGGMVTLVDGASSTESTIDSGFVDSLSPIGRNYQDVLALAPGTADKDGFGNVLLHGARDVDTVRSGQGGFQNVRPSSKQPPAVAVALTQALANGDRALSFDIPGRLTIPSDGQGHQQLIMTRDAEARIEYHCVPALSRDVFLVARWTIPADVTLLPGRMSHFVEGDLVGRSDVAPHAGGEELTLSFGPEGRLRADRRDLLLRTARRGRDEERDRKVVTTLENHLGRPVTVKVSDRVPISGDDRIDVTMNQDETTAALPADPREPGILRWEVALATSAKADVTLRYRIRAPIGMLPVEP